MAIRKKKGRLADPISDRARALNEQIAALESEIKKLDSQLQHATTPRFRSTALPHGVTIPRATEKPEPAGRASTRAEKSAAHEPVFEEVNPIPARDDTTAPDQFNELGVRKYDLPAFIAKIRGWFTRPPAANPRLVTYLAAGGVRGLRPLRYEKRVARRRVILLAVIFLIIMMWIISMLFHNR